MNKRMFFNFGFGLKMSLLAAIAMSNMAPIFAAYGNVPEYIPWQDDFEDYDVGEPLIDGTNYWYGSSTNVIVQTNVVSDISPGTSTQAAIIPVDCTLSNRCEEAESVATLAIQMDAKLDIYVSDEAPMVDTNLAGMFYISSNGYFVVCDGSAGATPQWITSTNQVYTNEADWARIGVYANYTTKQWDLYADGDLVADDVGFINTDLTGFEWFAVYAGMSTAYVDNVSVSSNVPRSMAVLGTNNAVIISGTKASPDKGTDFGDVPRGFAATNTFAITNYGNEILDIHGWGISGWGADAFDVDGIPEGAFSLESRAVTNFNVTFYPTDFIAYDAELCFTNHSPVSNYIVNLKGEGAVRPMLSVTPGVLEHTIMSGHSLSNKNITVGNTGDTYELDFAAQTDVNWLFINADSSVSGTLDPDKTTNLTINTSKLTADTVITTYTGYINFTATTTETGDDAIGSPQRAEVNVTVTPQPRLRLSRTTLNNSTMKGYDAPSQRFDVWNGAGFNPMEFSIANDAPWLRTSITSGTSDGERHTVVVQYSTTGLKPGTTNATITVTGKDSFGQDVIDSPQKVNVTLEVQPVSVLSCDAVKFSHAIRTGESISPSTFEVWNGGDDPQSVLSYEVAGNVSWLSASPEKGKTVPGETDTITVSYNTANLRPGVYRGAIVVSGIDEGTGLKAMDSPKRIPVELVVDRIDPLDFSGDGAADMVVYHEYSGEWHVLSMSGESMTERFGGPGYKPTPGDYDGDGVVELGVYRASSAYWYSKPLDGYTILVVGHFGGAGYKPVRGDFDGDGRQDFALYCENTGRWFVMSPDGKVIVWDFQWGGPGFIPLAADFTGDGSDDLAVYSESSGEWYIITVEEILVAWGVPWGGPGFEPLAGDYNGNGMADLAVYYTVLGSWFITSLTEGTIAWDFHWGGYGFTPLAGDYSGDGKTDLAVYNNGLWFISTVDGTIIKYGQEWGGPGYTPIGM